MDRLSIEEKGYMKQALKRTFYFYRHKLTDKHYSMVDRGYAKICKTFVGPLKTEDPDIIVLVLTEAGRTIAEDLVYPS